MTLDKETRRARNGKRLKGKTLRISVLDHRASDAKITKDRIIQLRSKCFECPDGLEGRLHAAGTVLQSQFDRLEDTAFVRVQAIDRQGNAEDIAGYILVRQLPKHPVDVLTEGRLEPLPNSLLFTRAFTIGEYESLGINQLGVASAMILSCFAGFDALEMLIVQKLRVRPFLMECLHFKIADDARYKEAPGPEHLVSCNFNDGHPVDLLPIGSKLGDGIIDAWREVKRSTTIA